jgi:PAS domain S-box-containing protein
MTDDATTPRTANGGVSLDAMRPFFDASLDGIVVVDAQRRYLYVNPAAAEIFGQGIDELSGKDFLVSFPERMHQPMLNNFGSTLRGSPGLWQTTILRPDGSERDLEFSNLEFELGGEPLVGAIIRDLTDERQRTREAEAAARVAATFTLDRPLEEALVALCGVVRDSTTAVACSAVLLDEDGRVRLVGNVGQPPGYLEAMREVWASGAPSVTLPYFASSEPSFVGGAREMLLDNPDYAPVRAQLEIVEWDELLFAPMTYHGRPVGALNAFYPKGSPPRPAEVKLIKAMADQAAVAVENSRLLENANLRTAQLSALLDSSAAVNSTLDVDTVIASVLDQVSRIVDYSGAAIVLLEGDELVIVSARFGPGVTGYEGQPRLPLDRGAAIWSHILNGQPVRISDFRADTPFARELRDVLGAGLPEGGFGHIRSWIGVPLIAEGRVLGMLTASRSMPGVFTDEHEQLLAGLANHAANGIEKARLFREAEERTAETTALVRIASAMTFDQPPERVLDVLAENVVAVTGAVSCAVVIIDRSGTAGELAGTYNLAPGYMKAIEEIWQKGAFSPTREAFTTQEVQVVPNVRRLTLADDTFAPIHDFVRDTPWNTLVAVPLVYRGEPVGAMNVYYATDRTLAPEQMSYLRALADQAAVAGANVRLFAEGERRLRRAESLARVASAMTLYETPQAVLDLLAENVLVVTGAASSGIIVTDKTGSQIEVVGRANMPEGYMDTIAELWKRGTRVVGFDAVRSGEVVIAHDLPALSRGVDLLEPFREFTEKYWYSLVAIPLQYVGESVGTLNVCYPPGSKPGDDDMAILRALADQAAVVGANVRLFAEAERRRHRAEVLASVAGALTYERSIGSTLDALTRMITEATNAVASSVTLVEEKTGAFTLAASHGLPESFTRVIRDAWSAGRTTMMTLAIDSKEPRVTRRGKQRFLEDPDFAEAHDVVREVLWEPVALVPLIYRGRAVGLIGAFYRPGEVPGPDEMALLSAIADQAAVAVENSQLFGEIERRLRQVEAVQTIASNLAVDQPLDEMMGRLAGSVCEATGSIGCSIILVDESAALPMRIVAMSGLPHGYKDALQAAYNGGAPSVIVQAFRDREPTIIPDSRNITLADPRFDGARALVADEPWDVVGVIPIIYRHEPLGLLVGYYPRGTQPDSSEITFLTAIADQAAIAIKNASLIEQAQETAAVAERQRLARELHDSVSQALYGIALGAKTARTLLDRDPARAKEPVDYVLQLAQAGLAEMRALIFELRPESLAQEGIVAALEKQVAFERALWHQRGLGSSLAGARFGGALLASSTCKTRRSSFVSGTTTAWSPSTSRITASGSSRTMISPATSA